MESKIGMPTLFWNFFFLTLVSIANSEMVPYYLGNSLIMVDSYGTKLPTRHQPSSNDANAVNQKINFEDNDIETAEDLQHDLPSNENDEVMSVEVTSGAINTVPKDVGSSRYIISNSNRGRVPQPVNFKSDNKNLIIKSSTINNDEISFNGIVEFVDKSSRFQSTLNQRSKPAPEKTSSHSTITNEGPPDLKTDKVDNLSKLIIENATKNATENATENASENATENAEVPSLSNLIYSDTLTKDGIENSEVFLASTTERIRANLNLNLGAKPLEALEDFKFIDTIALNQNDSKSTGSHSPLKFEAVKDASENSAYSSNMKNSILNPETDKIELMNSIEETLNNYFKADNDQTTTETLERKLQNILNFLKNDETRDNSRNSKYLKKNSNFKSSIRDKRDAQESTEFGRLINHGKSNGFNEHFWGNSVEDFDDDFEIVVNLLQQKKISSLQGELRNLDHDSFSSESNSEANDDFDVLASFKGTNQNTKSITKSHKIPSRRITKDSNNPTRFDDYIDYDLDYYDYYDPSTLREGAAKDNATASPIDEIPNASITELSNCSSLVQIGNYTTLIVDENCSEIDDYGNFTEIIDFANITDIEDYDTDNSTGSTSNVTDIEQIEILELLISKKTCRCGVPVSKTKIKRIVKGKDSSINEYPWMVQIAEKKDGYVFCGGSIVNDMYILTAAHCLVGYHPRQLFVRMGHTNATNNLSGRKAFIKTIILHPKYRDQDGTKYDIGLMRLRRPIKYTENVLPVCLSYLEENDNKTGIIMGWGTQKEGGEGAKVLQETSVNIMEAATCRNVSAYLQNEIPDKVICAGGNGSDSCQGDSGGPLVIEEKSQYFLVGITSWGIGCGEEAYPGVYTKVSLFTSWIKLKTKDALYCQAGGENSIRKFPERKIEKPETRETFYILTEDDH